MFEFIALGILMDAPLTGYDFKKAMESGIGTFYKASYSSLYPLLKKLTEYEKRGCSYYKLSTLYYGINAMQETLKWCKHIKIQDNLSDFINKN